ncbi:MAG TPA: sigma-70 family RNA polymerase sigma factor [Gemmatimonadaceae bacterium]|nr:sigma-70 family RNA polymerase sigma factor [Gemmatimonadaceae bacterium]
MGTTGEDRFPATRYSVVDAVRSDEEDVRARALETLTAAYWRPVYKYLRIKWNAVPQDAEDLTQDFFATALKKDFFARYDAKQARFRTYLRVCLDGFASNQRKAARRLKRGGTTQHVSLDFALAEDELRANQLRDDVDTEEFFRREWIRALFGDAVERLRQQCEAAGKQVHFALFERYDLDAQGEDRTLTYAQLAREVDLPVTQVTNYLAFARREFRRLVLERLREITGSDHEFRSEARELLGVDLQ